MACLEDRTSIGRGDDKKELVHVAGRDQAPRAFMFSRCGIAGDVSTDMTRDHVHISVVAAPGGLADDEANGFAFVKILRPNTRGIRETK